MVFLPIVDVAIFFQVLENDSYESVRLLGVLQIHFLECFSKIDLYLGHFLEFRFHILWWLGILGFWVGNSLN